MSQHIVKVKSVNKITHDVLKIVTEKPAAYEFTPGQATEVSINKNGWKVHKNPFCITSLPENEYLEFTVKTYPAHKNVTKEMLHLQKDDEMIVHDVFGTIRYQGEGVFIAGGAGVTPFISILRWLASRSELGNNRLVFANKTKVDVILEQELRKMLGNHFINILSEEKVHGYAFGQITEEFITSVVPVESKYYYVCGPPAMMKSIEEQLTNLQIPATSIIKEEF